jgi:hypothetical protein
MEFLRENPVPGNMINFFDIGGFLDWQLYPHALTFIDGRAHDRAVFNDHQAIMAALPGWELIVEKYGATYMVLKSMDSSGRVLPIVTTLATHSDWELVFADGIFLVFVRNTPETGDYIKRHRIDKRVLPAHVIEEAYHYSFLGVAPEQIFNTQAHMYLIMGQREKAIEVLREGVEKTGSNYLRSRLLNLMQ